MEYMVDYIANSKNRKFKKQVLIFFERLNFGAGKLPISGRIMLLMVCLLFISLFFPWIHFEYLSKESSSHSAFSVYMGYIGYGILLSIVLIPFFLLSHTKKERIRSIVPFRLSDTQAIVFVASMILTAQMHTIFLSPIFGQFAQKIEIGNGFLIATSTIIIIIIATFFLSRESKERSREMRYLDHHDQEILSDYQSIIHGESRHDDEKNKENMKLPI